MSDARKCDKCSELFEPTFGCVSLDISVKGQGKAETYQSWGDVDLCGACSASLLDLIGNALSGLCRPRVSAKKRRRQSAK